MTTPTGWRQYVAAVESGRLPRSTPLNRFAARYRIADAFERVEFDGLGEVTAEGYSIALKLSLSYSTLESFELALMGKLGRTELIDNSLAGQIRRHGGKHLIPLLTEEVDSNKLRSRIVAFGRCEHDNLRPVVEGIRHLTFHGILSPYGSGLSRSKNLRDAVESTSKLVMHQIDENFLEWLTSRLSESKP